MFSYTLSSNYLPWLEHLPFFILIDTIDYFIDFKEYKITGQVFIRPLYNVYKLFVDAVVQCANREREWEGERRLESEISVDRSKYKYETHSVLLELILQLNTNCLTALLTLY